MATLRRLGGSTIDSDENKSIEQLAEKNKADLRHANLRHADFGLPHLPVIPGIDAAILSAIEMGDNALAMGGWHMCETTHCRAGWAIHLAGPAGYMLEDVIGPSAAGALIYAASGSHPVPDWHTTNEAALADMRARAAKAKEEAE